MLKNVVIMTPKIFKIFAQPKLEFQLIKTTVSKTIKINSNNSHKI